MGELSKATKEKYNKPQVFLGVVGRFPRAMLSIARVSEYGAVKHKVPMGDMGYVSIPGANTLFKEAMMRHAIKEGIEGPINEEDGNLLHKAQTAWCALADLEVYLSQNCTEVV